MFYGKTYLYPTPNAGDRTIGVTRGLGDNIWIVAYISPVTGGRHRIKSPHLRPDSDPVRLQRALERFAADHNLRCDGGF